jgi:hypothetical protein
MMIAARKAQEGEDCMKLDIYFGVELLPSQDLRVELWGER